MLSHGSHCNGWCIFFEHWLNESRLFSPDRPSLDFLEHRVVENWSDILANRWKVFLTTIMLSSVKVQRTAFACVCLYNYFHEVRFDMHYSSTGRFRRPHACGEYHEKWKSWKSFSSSMVTKAQMKWRATLLLMWSKFPGKITTAIIKTGGAYIFCCPFEIMVKKKKIWTECFHCVKKKRILTPISFNSLIFLMLTKNNIVIFFHLFSSVSLCTFLPQ